MGQQAELAHLFRALKAPAAARALPKLADRARAEEWSYERFVQTLLETEVSARDSHGGEARIRQARFPARKTLEEFDFTFQRSVEEDRDRASRPARLPTRQGLHRRVGPARYRQDTPQHRAGDPRLPRRSPRAASAPRPNGSPGSPTPNTTAGSRTSSPRFAGSHC